VALCVLSADCVPILMADSESAVVGALHAGWRGVIADIATAGVRAMVAAGAAASRLRAALGPAIGGCCFEVDEELAERFKRRFPGAANHIRKGTPGKGFVDLKAILRDRLIAAGLSPAAITSVGPCTRCAADRYFSRRAAPDGQTGLQLSYIALGGRGR
jgi:YfiH family protein